MFALEVEFKDGNSPSEFLLVRRPNALIGASDFADVVIDDMRGLEYQLRIVKGLGRQFVCLPVGLQENSKVASFLEGTYESQAEIDLGDISLHITVLDSDLFVKDGEPPDRAGVRVLRQAIGLQSPVYPAIVVLGAPPVIFSFFADQQVVVGRSKKCSLRLDTPEISAEHARFGYESGMFWVEDLGSTNGTFVEGHQVAGKQPFEPAGAVVLGRSVTIIGVNGPDQLQQTAAVPKKSQEVAVGGSYPVLLSKSELVRPARLVMQLGGVVNVGRDPSSDIWLGAPHVSRKHCSVALSKSGIVAITDYSTNGTAHDRGVLKRGNTLEMVNQPNVLDFGGDITLAVCWNQEQEEQFTKTNGARNTFTGNLEPAGPTRVSSAVAAGSVNPTPFATFSTSLMRKSRLSDGLQAMRSLGPRARMVLVAAAVCLLVLVWMIIELLTPRGF